MGSKTTHDSTPEFDHVRVDLVSTERHPDGDAVVGAWVSLCDSDDASLLTAPLGELDGADPHDRCLDLYLRIVAERATASWPAVGRWADRPTSETVFVDHRATVDGASYEVIGESLTFSLADVAALPKRVASAA